jgi:hypothetical protein
MTLAQAFDEWQREYERNPDGFGNGMQASRAHKRRQRGRAVSELGYDCAQLIRHIMRYGRSAWKLRKAGLL